MAASDDDEDLKMAIAMSMQQTSPKATKSTIANNAAVDLTSDTEDEGEDEDIRRAIALSLQETAVSGVSESAAQGYVPASSALSSLPENAKSAQSSTDTTPSQASSAPTSLFGLDRKAMEQERLARVGKRKRDPSPERPSKQIAMSPLTEGTTVKPLSTQNTMLQYPRGAIKRTFAAKYPRTDDITLDEVLQADTVNIAVISSFMWDSEWLYKKLNPVKVKQIWIMNAKDRDVQERFVREMKDTQVPNLKLHFPPMDGMIHSMHSKFMLLFGKDKLRIAVPTANMIPTDWGEVENDWQPGVMENSVFMVDVPRRADESVRDQKDLTPFGQELVYFLEKQELGRKVIEGVLKFDFSQTGHLAFVHSM